MKIRIFMEYNPDYYMYLRKIQGLIEQRLSDDKVIVLLGARQTGKTTLVEQVLRGKESVLHLNGDLSEHRKLLEDSDRAGLKDVIGANTLVFVDEAQRVAQVGLTAKIMQEELGVKVILTGSSALELNRGIQEPLTGRKWTFELFPLSYAEIAEKDGLLSAREHLTQYLIKGSYPEVVSHGDDRSDERLRELYTSYLFKDILALSGIRKPLFLERLLKALAYQMSQEISLQELARTIELDAKTVEQYIQLLEQSYVVHRLGAYRRILRTELSSKQKIFFWDNGIRNAVIGDLSPWALRQDKGQLWENFVVTERIKRTRYARSFAQHYFWRTVRQQEIDLIEVENRAMSAYEIKWKEQKVRFSKAFTNAYPEAHTQLIHRENFETFIR